MKRMVLFSVALAVLIFFPALPGSCQGTPFGEEADVTAFDVKSPEKASSSGSLKKTDERGLHIRVGGYNIAHARGKKSGGFNEFAKLKNLRGIANLLKGLNVEIIGFTEISRGDLRAGFRDQPEYIAKKLGYHSVYAENYSKGIFGLRMTQGNALVSKYPIVSSENHKLFRNDPKHEQRSCLEALIDLGKGKKIRVLVAHLSLIDVESTRQIEEIWAIAEKKSEPVILIGDFNSRPSSDRIKWLSKRMKDTSANLKTPYLNKPGVKIDYHFTFGPIKPGKATVTGFDEGYSDHGLLFNDYWL